MRKRCRDKNHPLRAAAPRSFQLGGKAALPSAMDIIFIYVAGNQFDCLHIYFGFGCSLAEGCTGMTAPMFIIINQGSRSGSQRCSENA